MEAGPDRHWLLGDPRWWGIDGENPPDFREGELSPPSSWVSTTPRVGNFGWCRQRYRPLAWPLLRPFAWAPLFLALAAIPVAFPGRTPNDQLIALASFSLCWALVTLPLAFARNAQPLSEGGVLSLPLDWTSLALATAFFPMHIVYDSRLGWVSYALFWFAYIRTVQNVQHSMRVTPARFLLPVNQADWVGGLNPPWEVHSTSWARKSIASAKVDSGRLVIAGASRSGQDFLAIAFVHDSGFVHDPFHVNLSSDQILSQLLESPPTIVGTEWPRALLDYSEEE